jgi:hypothetical protein
MIPSAADHLRGKVDPRHTHATLGECDGQLAASAPRVENACSSGQAKRVPDAIEIGRAIRPQGIRLGAGIPALRAGVPSGT